VPELFGHVVLSDDEVLTDVDHRGVVEVGSVLCASRLAECAFRRFVSLARSPLPPL